MQLWERWKRLLVFCLTKEAWFMKVEKFTTFRLSDRSLPRKSKPISHSCLKKSSKKKRCYGKARKDSIFNRQIFFFCPQQYEMLIGIWFKPEYWFMMKFILTNQSEVLGCQKAWLAYQVGRENVEDTEGSCTSWGALVVRSTKIWKGTSEWNWGYLQNLASHHTYLIWSLTHMCAEIKSKTICYLTIFWSLY